MLLPAPATFPFTAADLHGVCQGRLTLQSGAAIPTSDQTAKSTVYFTPFLGNRVALYDTVNSVWVLYSFVEISKSLSSLTSGKNYDVFLYSNSGTLTLELSAAWSSDGARSDSLSLQDGVLLKNADKTRRWLGTIRTTSTTTTEDSTAKRFVMNAYNKAARQLFVCPGYSDNNAASTYTRASATPAEANGAAKIEWLADGQNAVALAGQALGQAATLAYFHAGIGLDSASQYKSLAVVYTPNVNTYSSVPFAWNDTLAEGYHYASLLVDSSSGTATFYADSGRSTGESHDDYCTFLKGEIYAWSRNPQAILTDALFAAGLPISGVRADGSIIWQTPPDANQSASAQIVAAIDMRPRRGKSLAAFTQAFNALSSVDQARLDAAIQSFQRWQFLCGFPDFARKLPVPIALDGDEIDTGN